MIRRDEPTKTGKDARIGTTTLDWGYAYDVTAHDMRDMSGDVAKFVAFTGNS